MNKGVSGLIVMFLLVVIVSTGCVTESKFGGNPDKITSAVETDVNRDGLVDYATYSFANHTLDGIRVRRVITVRPVWNLTQAVTNISGSNESLRFSVSPDVLDSVRALIIRFNQSRGTEDVTGHGEAFCKRTMGLDLEEYPCTDKSSCTETCSYSYVCNSVRNLVGEMIVTDLLDLNNDFKEIDHLTDDTVSLIDSMAAHPNNVSKKEVDTFLTNVQRLSLIAQEVNQNPIVNPSVYGLCFPIEYDTEALQSAVSIFVEGLSVESTVPTNVSVETTMPSVERVRYDVVLFITVPENQTLVNGKIVELIPPSLNLSSESIHADNLTSVIDKPLSLEKTINKLGSGKFETYLYYYFHSDRLYNGSWFESHYSVPVLTVKQMSLESFPVIGGVWVWSNSMYASLEGLTNPFFALGVTVLVLIICLKLVYLLLTLLFTVIGAFLTKRDVNKAFKEWLGRASPVFWEYLVIGAVLIIIGYYFTSNYTGNVVGALNMEMFARLFQTHVIETAGMIMVVMGGISVWLGIEDTVRAYVFRTGFYESVRQRLYTRNRENLSMLKKELAEVEKLLQSASKMMIDIFEEQEMYHSIPIDRIERLVEEEDDQKLAEQLITQSLNKIDMCKASLEQKISIASTLKSEWLPKIKKMLSDKGKVTVSMLVGVPKPWREWLLESYLVESGATDLIIENGVLKHVERPAQKRKILTQMVEEIASSEIPVVGVVGLDGKVYAFINNTNVKVSRQIIGILVSRVSKMIKSFDEITSSKPKFLAGKIGNWLYVVRYYPDMSVLCIADPKVSILNIVSRIDMAKEKSERK
ncbi:hypothetical protein J7K41_00690 [Candidatus Micrarchaeota archaeon]|nr:hypothetical protein [Candidatus Micrarchaeota archaeon]